MDPSDFVVIYPSYLDSTKTIAKGRRIGTENAVDTPTVSDISQALQSLNIRHVLQPHKGYSRDITTLWDNPGRVKVEPQSQYTKRGLLVELAKIIPGLPSRIQRLEQAKQQALLEEQKAKDEIAAAQRAKQQQQHSSSQQQKSAATSSSKSNKKKSRKKR